MRRSLSEMCVRRNILRRSSVGVIATGRWPAASGHDANGAAGVDADFRFFDNVQATAYWAHTSSAERGDDTNYRARFLYAGDRYGLEVEQLVIGPQFNPEVGIVRRGMSTLMKARSPFLLLLLAGRQEAGSRPAAVCC